MCVCSCVCVAVCVAVVCACVCGSVCVCVAAQTDLWRSFEESTRCYVWQKLGHESLRQCGVVRHSWHVVHTTSQMRGLLQEIGVVGTEHARIDGHCSLLRAEDTVHDCNILVSNVW